MASILPTRRFSGSRSNLRDEYELEFSDLSPSRASSPASARSEGPWIRSNPKLEEYRRKIARLKSELELEKSKSKHVLKEKSKELKHLRAQFDDDKQSELLSIEDRLKERMKKDVIKMREELIKEKDSELQQVLKYKEDEISHLKTKLSQSAESTKKKRKLVDDKYLKDETKENGSVAEASSLEEKLKISKRLREMDLLRRMEEEIQKLKDENFHLEQKYEKKCKEESAVQKEFTKVKAGYDAEFRRVISESKKLALGNLKKLKRAEIALSESFVSEDESLPCSTTSVTTSVCGNVVPTVSDSSHATTPSEGGERHLPALPIDDSCRIHSCRIPDSAATDTEEVTVSRRSSITSLARLFTSEGSGSEDSVSTRRSPKSKEGEVLFNDTLNTFYLWLYGIGIYCQCFTMC